MMVAHIILLVMGLFKLTIVASVKHRPKRIMMVVLTTILGMTERFKPMMTVQMTALAMTERFGPLTMGPTMMELFKRMMMVVPMMIALAKHTMMAVPTMMVAHIILLVMGLFKRTIVASVKHRPSTGMTERAKLMKIALAKRLRASTTTKLTKTTKIKRMMKATPKTKMWPG